MADPKPQPEDEAAAKLESAQIEGESEDTARVREAIGEGLRKFYDSVADEPIPAEWLALVGVKPEEPSS